MFEPDDIARSIRRYLGLLLPTGPSPDWTLRLERRVVSDDDRPVGVILLGTATTVQAREIFDQGNVVDLYPVTIYLYPQMEEDAQKARREGDAIRNLAHRWIRFGLPLRDGPSELLDENGRPKAGPFRLPLWDWEGIPAEGPADRRRPAENAHDTMIVVDGSLNAENLHDEEDERRRTVVIEFRIEVESPGRIDDRGGGTVSGIQGTFAGEL